MRSSGAASGLAGRAARVIGAASCVIGLAAAPAGCAEDSASPETPAPRLVSVLGEGRERATGFAVGAGSVVTVAHAVEGGNVVRVRAGAGSRPARVVRVDRRADLALLAVRGLRTSAADIETAASEDAVEVMVLRANRTASLPAVVRRAIDARVSAPGAGQPLRRPALELAAHTRAGDSGAPVVGEGGEVTGVVFARSRTRAETAYAVAAQALDRLLDGAGGGGG